VTGRAEARACVKCATPYALTVQTVTARGRELDLPFCLPCWRRLQLANRVVVIAAAFVALVLAGGAGLFMRTGRVLPLAVAVAVGVAAMVGALLFRQSARPAGV
jgi:hypothetical protein